MLKKIDRAKLFLEAHAQVFACPICHEKMQATESGLVCAQHHRFDLSKKGTLYFLKSQLKSDYDANLFAHRARMIQGGMYDPLLEILAKYLDQAKVLDIGCGEGSFLAKLTQKVTPALTVGFDIAKEGIYQASNHTQFDQAFWCVADLTNLPFADQSFDVLLNIFSPSNYREFDRILAPGGKLLKVIPGEHYLKELRQAFYPDDARKQHYSNKAVVEKLLQAYPDTTFEKVQYTFDIPEALRLSLLEMSPLEWQVDPVIKHALQQAPLEKITIDLLVAMSQKS